MQEHIFERMARERNISAEEMRAIISDRIEKGWNDKDPVKREQWRKIPCAGEIPTPDEWLSYVIKKIKAGEAWRQWTSPSERKNRGTGLGLRRIGGRIEIHGCAGDGACRGGTAASGRCVAQFQSHDHAVLVGCRPGSKGLYQTESPYGDTRAPL